MTVDGVSGFISDPMVYPVYLAFLLVALLFVVGVVDALRSGTFAWTLLGAWADELLGPTILLAFLGLVVWLAGAGNPPSPADVIVKGLAALYVTAVVTWDTTLAARIASHFGSPPPRE